VLPLALTTGHKIGLAVVGACFVAFALASSFLFPRFRAQFPGRGLPAFIVVAFVFFLGMLSAVEVFGAEPKETKKSERVVPTSTQAQPTTSGTSTASTQSTTTAKTTTSAVKQGPARQQIQVSEAEFKITLATTSLKHGTVTFVVKNAGKIPHDLAIAGTSLKTPLIAPGKTATLTAPLKAGPIELYCTVPGHKQAGMDLKVTVA
jgi:nitrite reductase (NO-forming)